LLTTSKINGVEHFGWLKHVPDIIPDYPANQLHKLLPVKHDRKIGWIVIDHIRTIDKQRIIRILGRLSQPEIKEMKSVIKETFVD